MREIHYIDIDEEIISAVSRLRQSGKSENVFVFPKRALILQSIVNLKLLQREADKLGKKIIVVSQDVAGKKLAEKVGLAVEEYQDQSLGARTSESRTRPAVDVETRGEVPLPEQPRRVSTKRSHAIGSQDFYGQVIGQGEAPALTEATPSVAPKVLPTAAAQRLRVRNTTPPMLTSLNSTRTVQDVPRPVIERPPLAASATPVMDSMQPMHSEPRSSFGHSNPAPSQPRLQRFMAKASPPRLSLPSQEMIVADQPVAEQPLPQEPKKATPVSPRSSLIIGTGVITLLILGVLGVGGWYILFPKATITLIPQTAEQVVQFSFTGVTNEATGDSLVPVRMVNVEKSVRVSDTATGTGAGTDSKARGKIRIYNDFSSAAQPLVATTRFETKEGKIFRLLQAVVVPGFTEKGGGGHEPGTVEAVVVADQLGTEYALPANTAFTIPGFKGSPKFTAFRAESLQSFDGGGDQSGAKKVISQADVDRVAAKALAEARSLLLEAARLSLSSGEVLVEPSLEVSEKSRTSTPLVGLAADTFDFEGRYEAKVFIVTSERMINERITKETVDSNGVTLVPRQHTVGYTHVLPKFDQGQLEMTVESTIQFHSTLDLPRLKQGLLGLDEEGIKAFLREHPEIARLQVEFNPQLIIATIPTDEERVKLQVAE